MLTELYNLADSLLDAIDNYEDNKTKKNSLKIRKITQRLNNIGPAVRKELIANDKKGK